jgi:putative lipoic acid-binding regulatory protein
MKLPENTDGLYGFPCEYPVKAMGKTGPQLESAVLAIINRHVKDLPEGAVRFAASKGGNYTSITITFVAQSKQQLDAIYMELTACEYVLYAL